MTFVSYSQNFEDIMLRRALKDVRQGFYVDVGAQHPIRDSVTKAFSLAGWRGINIEPVRHWFDMLESDRPYDINLNVAVSDQPGHLDLFEVEGTGLSTTETSFADSHREAGHTVVSHSVPTQSLDEILATHAPSEVHFLKVDCEGAERAALASCSFDTIRPWIVVVEATLPNSETSVHEDWEYLLTGRGYSLAYRDGLNRYYVADEHAELKALMELPPNVFDDFIRRADLDAHEAANDAHARLRAALVDTAEARATSGGLANHLQALDAQHAAWRESEHALTAALEAEREALRAANAALDARASESQAALERLRHRVENNEEVRELLARQHDLLRQVEALQEQKAASDSMVASLIGSTSWRITAPVRGAKLAGSYTARALWRMGRPVVVKIARTTRPAMHSALKVPLVRGVAAFVARPESRLGRRVRAFLFPRAIQPPAARPFVLTEGAGAVADMLQASIARKHRLK